jgi:mRNA interferase RelE/StbE
MGYVTRFTPHAQRDMLKIPRPDALRILHRLTELQKAMDAGGAASFDIKPPKGTVPAGGSGLATTESSTQSRTVS